MIKFDVIQSEIAMRELKKQAKKRVEEKKGFYVHFAVYAACAIFFFLLNVLTGGGRGDWWFFYPVLGWGLGVAIHYVSVFGIPGTDILSKRWEDRELEKEMSRLQGNKSMDAVDLPDQDPEIEELELKERELLRNKWNDDELV